MAAESAGIVRRVVSSRTLPWVLFAVSMALHVFFSLIGSDAFKLIDLRVYVEGSQHLADGQLYDFLSGSERLPFTYTPFAALSFVPLGALPWPAVVVLWEVGSVAALALIIWLTLRLLGLAGRGARRPLPHLRGLVVAGTAVAMWLEPVRSTMNYGQINLFLTAILLAGAVSTRQWAAGLSVGVTAGIKLIPAITGLYYLLQRRYAATAWCVVCFLLTLALPLALLPGETWRYFTELIFDPARTGAIWVTRNQGWRGALFRLTGSDVVGLWLVVAAVCLAVGIWATVRALRAGDRCAAFLAVQFTGLLISPISWSHHWVWVLPLLLWCGLGPATSARGVRVLGWCWAAVCWSFLVIFLIMIQNSHLDTEQYRPLWESVLDAVYPVLGTYTLVVLGLASAARTRLAGRAPAAAVVDERDPRG